jgi:dTDP-4-dehydrorhamnose reductase
MKILLTGMHGQVGFELQRALAPLGQLVSRSTRRNAISLTRPQFAACWRQPDRTSWSTPLPTRP